MRFKLYCVKLDLPDDVKYFYYDNATGLLMDGNGTPVGEPKPELSDYIPAFKADQGKNPIRKHNAPRVLKIQMGLSCNLSCDYCLQKYVPRPDAPNLSLISSFIEKVKTHLRGQPENIQLWGGEPLVYFKTLKPLVVELKKLFPNSKFTMITNGSLLNEEINDWIMENEIGLSISHDGPGQKHRGPDPFDDPETDGAIRDLYRRKKAISDPISIGAMIHAYNPDRAEVAAWMREKLQDPDVHIGEGSIIEVYDEAAKQDSPRTHDQRQMLRQTSFRNIRHGADSNFSITRIRMNEFLDTMQHGRMLDSLGMRCGMDREDTLTLDLLGNVITCQNTSIASKAPNGEPHKAGNIADLSAVEIRTSVHFMNRKHCQNCPVV
jgi:uncharacterized protein